MLLSLPLKNALLAFAFLSFLRQSLFWLYFWQLKEYRWSRIKEEISRNRKIIPWRASGVALIIFGLSLTYTPLTFSLVFLYFIFQGGRSLEKAFRRNWILPQKFTKKILLSLILAIVGWGAFIFLKSFFWLQAILLIEVILPFWIAGAVKLAEIPASQVKKKIIARAKEKREKHSELIVIGISGSYGKTTVKELLKILLSCHCGKEKVLTTTHHVNTQLGIAQTILQKLNDNHRFFVVEIGAYQRGEIEEVAKLVQPKIGILTGINEQHLALFGSLENIIQGKLELIKNLSSQGWAVLNGDCSHLTKNNTRISQEKFFVSAKAPNPERELEVKNLKVFQDHLETTLADKEESVTLSLPLIGKEQIINLLLAVFTVQKLGMTLKEIADCLKNSSLKSPQKIIRKKEGWTIIKNTYSTNPSAFLADLEHLKLWPGKKIIVTPGMIELGKEASFLHQKVGRKLGKEADLVIVIKNYYWKNLRNGFEEGKKIEGRKAEIVFLPQSESVIKKIKDFVQSEDVVLLEGRMSKNIIDKL
jgi:UDP-N-acetylmuramoyl-tripeptide--D-alanyl-D-alanine ligase